MARNEGSQHGVSSCGGHPFNGSDVKGLDLCQPRHEPVPRRAAACGPCGRASSGLWVATRAASPVAPHEVHERVEDGVGGRGVEVAGGLVAKEHPGGALASARQKANTLLLAARECGGTVAGAGGETERGSEARPPAPRRRPWAEPFASCGRMMFSAAENSRQEMVELVDEADLAPPRLGALAVRGVCEIDPAEPHGAAVGGIEKDRDMQKRRLAGSRGGHERHLLARVEA